MKRLSRHLLAKSQEAFVLGVEVFNKPSIRYRLEGFCFFLTNAWELLLKARIIEQSRKTSSIFYRPRPGQAHSELKSISLDDALRKVFPDVGDPIRRNVERISELRNAAAHLVIPEMEMSYSGLFQASVINYVGLLDQWFSERVTNRVSPGMLSLVFDYHEVDPIILQRRYGRNIVKYMTVQHEALLAEIAQQPDPRFCIPLTYRLALTKHPGEADIALTSGHEGNVSGIVVEVPKDVDKTHPYLASDVCRLVRERIGQDVKFSPHDFQAVISKERVKNQNNQYHYQLSRPKVHKYSEALVELICHRLRSHADYLDRAKAHYAAQRS